MDQKGTVSPVVHVAENSSNIFTTSPFYHGGRHDGPSQTDIKKRVRESSDKIELMCAIASLKAKSTPPRCPPA